MQVELERRRPHAEDEPHGGGVGFGAQELRVGAWGAGARGEAVGKPAALGALELRVASQDVGKDDALLE